MSPPTIAAEAQRIVDHHLLGQKNLNIPQAILDRASTITFFPKDATPSVPTPAKLSESSAALWAVLGLFSAEISQSRYPLPEQKVSIDIHSATLFAMSALIAQIDDKGVWDLKVRERVTYLDIGKIRDPYRSAATTIYKTADDKWFHLHGSLNTTNTLHMLDLPQEMPGLTGEEIKNTYKQVVATKTAEWLDIEANEFWRQPGVICYTAEEFKQTPHGKVTKDDPLYTIEQVCPDLPRVAWPLPSDPKKRPLSGIKVIDLTRVIAGPTISKILALLGADVLRISSTHLPEAHVLVFDTQVGKRDADINLKTKEGKLKLRQLVEEADVVLDGYRPGALEKLGFGRSMVHEIAQRRGKGIVYARENTYGWHGPWSTRSGYQQISDCATGVSWAQGHFLGLQEPVVPLLPNSDYQTGIVGAICITQALYQRATKGGSYNADTSLNQFNLWYLGLELHSTEAIAALKAKDPEFMVRHDTNLYHMVQATLASLAKTHGNGPDELFDPARYMTAEMRWDRDGEVGRFLDWSRIVRFSSQDSAAIQFAFDKGSCKPGSDPPSW